MLEELSRTPKKQDTFFIDFFDPMMEKIKNSKTIVKVNKNLEFSIIPEQCSEDNCIYNLHIQKIKGDFEIQKVTFNVDDECTINKETNLFQQKSLFIALYHTFYLFTDARFNEVISLAYELKIDNCKIKYLNEFECFRGTIILTDCDIKQFEYLVKRNSTDLVEITVANPKGVRINGQTEDYTFQSSIDENVNHKLSFIFESNKNEDSKDSLALSPNENTDSNSSLLTYDNFKAALDFVGKWDFESYENYDEYLKALGVGLIHRKIALNMRTQIVINVNGNHWHMESNTAVHDFILDFELGKEFEQTTSDGRKVLSTFTLDENGKLHQIQKATSYYEKDSIIDRYIEDGKLKIMMECNGIKAKCICNRVA